MLVIALTGGIGSGKTAVSDRLAALGAAVIDADRISRELTGPGGEAVAEIAKTFGETVVAADGALDRAALRRVVFADANARRRLEAILHPRIRARMQAMLTRVTTPYAVLVIPLLFETGQETLADRVLVVDLDERTQVERVQRRSGLDEAEVRRIIASQATREQRLAGADDVIENDGSPGKLRDRVDALHTRYLSLASQAGQAGRSD